MEHRPKSPGSLFNVLIAVKSQQERGGVDPGPASLTLYLF